jgi:uncharacterized MAPEG superfamily protein
MPEYLVAYQSLAVACLVLGVLLVVQLMALGVANRRDPHVPGMPVTDGHDRFFFRAARAHANLVENLPAYLLFTVAAVVLGASPSWIGYVAWAFVIARVLHTAFYYADKRAARSAMFGLGALAQLAMLVVVIVALVTA